MSLYSTSVSTAIIDPSFSSSRRCEFRIPFKNQAYLPNLRIGNLGLISSQEVPYALGSGVAASIARITLLDGEEELDSLREVGSWLTFKSFMRPNSEAASISLPIEGGAGRGYTSSTTMEIDVPLPRQKFANTEAAHTQNEHIHTGTLDLRVVFPFLGAITHLSTATFKNLRIVIEYQTDAARMVTQTAAAMLPLKPTVPILMADEITDQALISTLDKQMMSQPVYWDAIEVDRIGLPSTSTAAATATTAPVTQNVSLRSNGFVGKYMKRLLIQKSPQSSSLNVSNDIVQGFGGNGSVSMNQERANLRVNGRSLLGGQGYNTAAQMAMGVADTFGELNVAPYGAIQSVGLDNARILCLNAPAGVAPTFPSILDQTNVTAQTPRHAATTGQQSYMAFRVDSKVDALQIEYQRVGRFQDTTADIPGQGGTSAALDLTCYAEISKSMAVGADGWRIQYE